MVIDEVHEIISLKRSKWLENYISFNTQKRKKAINYFEKTFYKLKNNSYYGKCMENVRNRLKKEIIKKYDTDKIIKQQSKLSSSGIHRSYEIYDSYRFRQNEVNMDKPIYLGFSVLEMSKLLMYETYYNEIQTFLNKKINKYLIWILIALY